MTILRINKKEKNFLIVDKSCLQDPCLSFAAKGLHAYLMGLRDDSHISIAKLRGKSTNGRDSIRNLVNELKERGYISAEWVRNEGTGKYSHLEDEATYIDALKLTSAEYQTIKNNTPESRLFLYKQGRESILCKLDLSQLADELRVFSGNKKSVRLLDELILEYGANPDDWLPVFIQRSKKL